MKIIINLDTENAAFEDSPDEIDRLVDLAIEKMRQNEFSFTPVAALRDSNGNLVGNYRIEKSPVTWKYVQK